MPARLLEDCRPRRGVSPRPRSDPRVGSAIHLTDREQQVAQLIAEGLTNREIGRALQMSVHTVDRHVEHILQRLNVPRRSAIAAWVSRC